MHGSLPLPSPPGPPLDHIVLVFHFHLRLFIQSNTWSLHMNGAVESRWKSGKASHCNCRNRFSFLHVNPSTYNRSILSPVVSALPLSSWFFHLSLEKKRDWRVDMDPIRSSWEAPGRSSGSISSPRLHCQALCNYHTLLKSLAVSHSTENKLLTAFSMGIITQF